MPTWQVDRKNCMYLYLVNILSDWGLLLFDIPNDQSFKIANNTSSTSNETLHQILKSRKLAFQKLHIHF